MEMNWTGLAAAVSTFLGVWLGHVSVRRIEREVERIWIPAVIAFVLGVGLEIASILIGSRIVSTVFGILGVTLLWDTLELAVRQPRRVMKGHAPANPKNPRHAQILATHPTSTTIDWLDRDPRGSGYTREEILAVKDGSQ